MPVALRSPALLVALLALLCAFAFLGSRGIWEPDEGRYTNVALNMLRSGDWIELRRNDDVGHWTKPPLAYWAIAASVGVFGSTPWAARLPMALACLLGVWLAWRIARRLAPDAEVQSALVYATMLLPFGASQLVTTDSLLAACLGLAALGFVEARFGARERSRTWLAVMWAGFALGFLAKGPPALLPLLAFLAFDLLAPARRIPRLFDVAGLTVFALLALPWYLAVVSRHPGLLQYFLGDEIVDRIVSDRFNRHGSWYGWLQIYVPTLLVGTLPWTPALLRWARALPASLRRWRAAPARGDDAPALLLACWLLLPLLAFCLARSRLPLYLLPGFLPIAILIARQRHGEGRGLPRWPWICAWVAVLLGLKLVAAHWPTHKDSRAWAEEIRARAGAPVPEVVFVEDMARYGLHLHLGAEIEKISLAPVPSSSRRFDGRYDEDLGRELDEAETGDVWICKQALWPELSARIAARGYRAEALGAPYYGRVIFRIKSRH